jgi:hypothetical protein
MDKTKSKLTRLLWILDFINQDIDLLSSGDFLKYLAEIKANIHKFPFYLDSGSREDYYRGRKGRKTAGLFVEDTPSMRELIKKEVHTRLKNFLEEIYKAKSNYKLYKDGQRSPRIILSNTIERHISAGYGEFSIYYTRGKCDLEEELAILIHDCTEPVQKQHNSKSEEHSLENLKKCQAPGCHNFFWQAHKKEKNYCSTKCAWRVYAKAKRDLEKNITPKKRKEG